MEPTPRAALARLAEAVCTSTCCAECRPPAVRCAPRNASSLARMPRGMRRRGGYSSSPQRRGSCCPRPLSTAALRRRPSCTPHLTPPLRCAIHVRTLLAVNPHYSQCTAGSIQSLRPTCRRRPAARKSNRSRRPLSPHPLIRSVEDGGGPEKRLLTRPATGRMSELGQ
jgi:hypothetical protein